MSEAIDFYNDLKKIKTEKRAANRSASATLLERAGVIFETKNAGAHLIVLAGRVTVDFWPGTGLWIARGSSDRRRGVRKLIEFVEKQRGAR